MSRRRVIVLTRTVMLAAIFVAYEVLVRTGFLDPFSWASATAALGLSWELVTDPVFLTDTIWQTLRIILISTALAILSGLVVGTALWRFPWAYATANPYLTLYYSIPAFAFYPVLLSIVGAGPLSLILLASLLGFAAMTANVVIGLRTTKPIHVKLGHSLRLGELQMLQRIYFPSAVPQILVGIRLAIAYAVIGVVGGEFLTGTSGLGYYIQFSYNSYQLLETYAGITIVVVTALLLNGLIFALSKVTFAMETVGS